MRVDWLGGLRSALGWAPRRRIHRKNLRRPALRNAKFEVLEDRRLLAVDFGDAPDIGPGTGVGNYNTLSTDNGPQHTIVVGLKMGANVDGDGGALQNAAANADDVNGALPDDEDGLTNPAEDLVLTVGAQPTVNVRVTNTTGVVATLYGWIDVNADGVFDNSTERSSIAVPNGTNNGIVTVTFPVVPSGFTGTTYARFRLSTDIAAANPTGQAGDGEVEDYKVDITNPSSGFAESTKTKKIASSTNGGPILANSDYFGRSVAAIGDIDGDGVTDLAVGAVGDDTGGSARGAVHVMLMNSNGSVKSRQKISNFSQNGAYAGSSVAALGDIDGDGVPDLAVGLERDDTGGSNTGRIIVFYLNSSGTVKGSDSTYYYEIGGLSDGDYFGHSIASVGDLDGDGVTDMAVGATGDDSGGTNRGAVRILFMELDGQVKSFRKIASGTGGAPSLSNSDYFGSSLASVGDLDGDGVSDLAVGAIYDDVGGTNRGAVHILFMNSDGTVKGSQKIGSGVGGGPTLADGDQFGASVAAVGDLDGDGVTDIAVGANYDDTGGTSRGAVYLLYLNSDGTVKSSQKIASGVGGGPTLADDDRFGTSVTSMGDLDGDGFVDLAVGANFDDTGGINRGAVYTLFLQPVLGNTDPVFTSPNTANVAENTAAVMTVTATDADIPAQTVTFSLVGGADQSKFSITSGGVLSFNSAPNFETPTDSNGDNVYTVTVQASDGNGGTATQTINVTVSPVNDNNPVFTSANTANVAENTTAVTTVTATDADIPAQTVTFSLVGGADQSKFGITTGGVLSFNSAPDLENPTDSNGDNVYVVTVQASDGNGGTATQTINVTVTPVNDNNPVFTSANTANVAENTTAVMTVTATDADLPAQTVTFSIVGGADQSKFGITTGGVLSFNSAPDLENPTDSNGDNVYVVIVQASDGNGGTTLQTINVTVTPVNDNSPVFTSANTANVAENTTAVMTVTATDADVPAQTVTYSIAGGADQSKFVITSGGALSFNSAPDYENPTDANADNVYVVTVQASDGEGGNTLQTINVTVTPVNDNNPVFTSANNANVAENLAAVMTVTATDADLPAQTVTYSIVGGVDQSKFVITSGGVLSFNSAPDYENPTDANGDNVYTVTVQASDGNGGTTLQTINVTVSPVNESIPVFTSPATANVPENTTAVMTVTATDAESPPQVITYSIVGGADQARFSITNGGSLSFVAPPDYEMPTDSGHNNIYEVMVQASDGAGGTATQTINVTVLPVNDNIPIFTSPNAKSVPENSTAVLTVTATDADAPAQTVTYSIVGGADQSKFNITSGGVLSFKSAPDFEAPTDANGDNVYIVTVQASDGNGGTPTQTISVTVTPVNDNSPVFTSSPTVGVLENSTFVMTVTATDADLPAQPVTFSLAGGADQSLFSVSSGGVLTFDSPPDFEMPGDADGDNVYLVAVQASDGNGRTAIQTINIAVTPFNDNKPVFTSPDMVTVPENRTAVLTVTATDADLPAQTVTFSLGGGADVSQFAITPNGQLSFLSPPDFDAPTDYDGDNTYVVTVFAADSGGASSTQTIHITVTSQPPDFGDAPDGSAGTGPGNYNTRASDNGPQHNIVDGLRMGAHVDADNGELQNTPANADDVNGALPDDEDGLVDPAADLVLTVGTQPTVDVRVTNLLGTTATLYGWIDYDGNGEFNNGTERAAVSVPGGTNNGLVSLTFPTVPSGFTGTTYARFRLSTDAAAANPTGVASDGEVEDYRATITLPSDGRADPSKSVKIAGATNGGPVLSDGDGFGRAVTAIGDVDGDGVVDLAVGANDSTSRGVLYVMLMNADGTVKSSQKVGNGIGGGPAVNVGDRFGRSVAVLGDLDGDGVVDLAVGADLDDAGGANRGAVHILFLNSDGTVKNSHKIASGVGGGPNLADHDHFGSSLAAVGDLDGDGVVDLAVGANFDDTGGPDRGAVHILFLNPDGSVKGFAKIANGTNGGPILADEDRFGVGLAAVGDLDADGVTELAVGAYLDDTGGVDAGAAYLLFLTGNGGAKASQKIASGTGGGPVLQGGDHFGRSVAFVGDLNGDGVNDLLVGANYDDTHGDSRGAMYALFLNADGTVNSSRKIADQTGGGPVLPDGGRFGTALTTLGDLDGDGFTDLAVGAEYDNTGGTQRGAVHVLFLKGVNTDPVITSPASVSIAENTTSVMTVTATDAEVPPQVLTFSLAGGADESKFSITDGGVLSFVAAPDYESPTDADGNNVYEVTVLVEDGEEGKATQPISVTVTPVNEHDPVFTSPDSVNVAENSTAVVTVTATDADLPAATLVYSLVGGADQSKFSIIGDGALSFITAPDFEAPTDANGDNTYVVIVQASDGTRTSLDAILVTVTPVNDLSPVFTSPATVFVAENSTAVTTVTAIDGDQPAQTVTFSLAGGADWSKFSLSAGGVLTFLSAPNFEAPGDADGDNTYEVIVRASDGGLQTDQAVSVSVVNVRSPAADFDEDEDVDGRDFLAWQRGFQTPAPDATKADGDADNDQDVDSDDLSVWQMTVGYPLVSTESFDYPDGPLAGQSGGIGWDWELVDESGSPPSASAWEVISESATIQNGTLVTTGGRALRSFAGPDMADEQDAAFRNTGIVYYGVDYRIDDPTQRFAGMSAYEFDTERVFFGKPSNQSLFGIDAAQERTLTDIPVVTGQSYRLVAALDLDNHSARLWVDPDSADFDIDPGDTSADAIHTYTGDIWNTAIRLASSGAAVWDNLVVSTSFEKAISSDPGSFGVALEWLNSADQVQKQATDFWLAEPSVVRETPDEIVRKEVTFEATAVDRAFDGLGSIPLNDWDVSQLAHSRLDFHPAERFELQTEISIEDELVEVAVKQM